jgi:thiamine-phosphate pyrophosphorylase
MSEQNTRRRRCSWGLYVITDARIAGRPHAEIVRAALAGGARVIQLRDKLGTFEELMDIGREIRELTRAAGAAFICNDNPYLARELDADGVHLGQNDCPVEIARDILGPGKLIGLSTHTKAQALEAELLPVDYIGIGPVYETTSKVSEWPVVGTSMIRWVRRTATLPIVAIGGITIDRIVDCVAAGADNVAVIGDLMGSDDIEARTRQMCEAYQHAVED